MSPLPFPVRNEVQSPVELKEKPGEIAAFEAEHLCQLAGSCPVFTVLAGNP